jgi:hypothetical protein
MISISQFERLPLKVCVLAEFRRRYSGKTQVKIRTICFTELKNMFTVNIRKMKIRILLNPYMSIFHFYVYDEI